MTILASLFQTQCQESKQIQADHQHVWGKKVSEFTIIWKVIHMLYTVQRQKVPAECRCTAVLVKKKIYIFNEGINGKIKEVVSIC